MTTKIEGIHFWFIATGVVKKSRNEAIYAPAVRLGAGYIASLLAKTTLKFPGQLLGLGPDTVKIYRIHVS